MACRFVNDAFTKYEPVNSFKSSRYKLAKLRRQLSRKVKFSKNHAMIVIEDLKVSNMPRPAKGTTEQHGRNVRAKSGLNRSIPDQGWYEMRRTA